MLLMLLIALTSFNYGNEISQDMDLLASKYGSIKEKRFLYDKDDKARFILYEYENDSYAIYDTLTGDYLERSYLPNSSPYKDVNGKCYYLGLNGYVIKSGSTHKNIISNEKINISFFSSIPIEESTKNNVAKLGSVDVSYKVPYGEYFEALDGIHNVFPSNLTGDCGYVAATILLSYFATFYNSDIICEHNMDIANSNYLSNPWENVSCATTQFKNSFLKENVVDDASTAFSVSEAVGSYMDKYTNVTYSATIGVTQTTNQIKGIVRNGVPVLMFTNVKIVETGEVINLHAVLVYGVSSNNRLIAHLGYSNRSCVEVANAVLGISGTTYYIDPLSITHKHSNYYTLEDKAFCQMCQTVVSYNPYASKYTILDDKFHNKICLSCDHSIEETHSFTRVGDYKTCRKCSMQVRSRNPFDPIIYE